MIINLPKVESHPFDVKYFTQMWSVPGNLHKQQPSPVIGQRFKATQLGASRDTRKLPSTLVRWAESTPNAWKLSFTLSQGFPQDGFLLFPFHTAELLKQTFLLPLKLLEFVSYSFLSPSGSSARWHLLSCWSGKNRSWVGDCCFGDLLPVVPTLSNSSCSLLEAIMLQWSWNHVHSSAQADVQADNRNDKKTTSPKLRWQLSNNIDMTLTSCPSLTTSSFQKKL